MAIVLRKLFIVWSFSFSKPGLFHRRAPGRRGENSAHKHHHSAAHARYPQIENAELHPQRTQQRVERRIEQGENRLDGVVDKEIGRAHVWTPFTNGHLVCCLPLEKKKNKQSL